MRHKNAWNKVYEEVEIAYKEKDENGKWERVTETRSALAKPGMKPSKLECEFSKAVKKMKTDKPKKHISDSEKQEV